MTSPVVTSITIDPSQQVAPTRDLTPQTVAAHLPAPKHTFTHPKGASGKENASIYFVGTATTIIEWENIRLLTDPNFIHAGDHVHLGPGVTGTRLTNPAIDLHDLPRIDLVLLSHYHADHFDEKVEASLRRDLPIITTPHAKDHLANKGENESFTAVQALDFFESCQVNIKPQDEPLTGPSPVIRVTGMPGKHVPDGILSTLNDLASAVPPTNGWMLELGYQTASATNVSQFTCGYRIYISGDTLLVDDLKQIPEKYPDIDLMLAHLGGTTIPSPKLPLLMVTMDAEQGIKLMQMIDPDVTIPIHYDDYDVFLSPLDDFKKLVKEHGLDDKVVYLDRADGYKFTVKK